MKMKKDMMMTFNKKTQMGACPECDSNIVFHKQPTLGQKKKCPECLSELEVIGLSPIELDWEFEYEYVDDDEGYDEDDY
jgi:lysine biosynthesis protein LysW